jgi:hypothetical protein
MVGDFEWMIEQEDYRDTTLFVFNDNESQFMAFRNGDRGEMGCGIGGGNAAIRPYQCSSPPRSAGVPMGSWSNGGYRVLDDHTKALIDRAIQDIRNLLSRGHYERVIFSESDGTLRVGIFTPSQGVNDYIFNSLLDIFEETTSTTAEETTSTTRQVTTTQAQSGGIASPQLRQYMEAFTNARRSGQRSGDVERIIAQIAVVARSGTGGLSPVEILRTVTAGWNNPSMIQLIMFLTNLNVERGQEIMFAQRIGLSQFCDRNEVNIRQAVTARYGVDRNNHNHFGVRGDFESEVALILRSFAADLPLYCPNIFDTMELKEIAWRYRMHRIIYYENGHRLDFTATRQTAFRESTGVLSSGNVINIRRGIDGLSFNGEIGMGHGLIRDWFSEMTTQIFNPGYGLFELREEEPRYIAISPIAIYQDDFQTYLRVVGRFMALAIIQRNPIGVSLPVMFFAKLMEQDVRLDDIQTDEPDLYRTLTYTMSTSDHELSGLELYIEIGGATELVTSANREGLVQRKINSLISADVEFPFQLIKEGFNEVIPIETIKGVFTPAEVKGLMFGNPTIDVEDLSRNVQFGGDYTRHHRVIGWLFNYLRELDQDTLKKFLRFSTGTTQVPFGGFAYLSPRFTIDDGGSSNRLPTASTCFYLLHLPRYTSEQDLRTKLHQAITGADDFGFL